jgi:hypothetical protein
MADRRRALSAIGTAFLGGLAGCISDLLPGSDETVSDRPVLTKTIREGNYYLTSTTGPDHVEYTVEVIEGPRVDVLLIDRSGSRALQNENFDQFTYYENMSSTHTLFAEASGELEGDFFGLVVDNSDNVGASPAGPGEAVVNIDTRLIFRS